MAFDEIEALDSAVIDYWDERSTSYSNHVAGELRGQVRGAWRRYLAPHVAALPCLAASAESATKVPRVLDLGCGPGFFEIVLGELGCEVHGVDSSPEMLQTAKRNIDGFKTSGSYELHLSHADELPFADESFDLIVCRNLTWLMQDLEDAYREWQRVLVPGGKLLVFDAGWYSYLADAEVNEQRLRDQEAGYPGDWAEDTLATSDEEKRCEDIAAQLQTSYLVRPAWDKVTLAKLGFDRVRVDHQAGNVLWTEEEQAFYRATPFFAVEAMK